MEFKEIYSKYNNLIYNLSLQYVQNTEDAEEITQDVLMVIYEKLDGFKNLSDIKTWIYRITINKSLDFLKAKQRRKRSFFFNSSNVDDSYHHNSLSDFNHPGVLLEQKEAIGIIFKAINQLRDNQKTVVILLKIEQKSYAEAAEIMNISAKAVESLFQRAKNNLENILNGNEGK